MSRSGKVAAWLKSERFVKVTRPHDSSSLTIRNVCTLGNSATIMATYSVVLPEAGTWSLTNAMSTVREAPTATLMFDGRVLVTGGVGNFDALRSAEIYDSALSTWSSTGSMATPRHRHTSTLLLDGRVLVIAGFSGTSGSSGVASSEIYDPVNGRVDR